MKMFCKKYIEVQGDVRCVLEYNCNMNNNSIKIIVNACHICILHLILFEALLIKERDVLITTPFDIHCTDTKLRLIYK